jgi:putative ABC transport system permease protein
MLRSFERLSRVKPGFVPAGVFTAKISLPSGRYGKPQDEALLATELIRRAKAVPGVESAALAMYLPFDGLASRTNYWVGGQPIPPDPEQPGASVLAVSPDYFRTLGIPVLRGRTFTDADAPGGHRVVVINQALATSVFPGQNPIGREIDMPWNDTLRAEIVAVVGDIRSAGLDSLPEPTTYWPLAQFQTGGFALLARTAGDPMDLARPLAGALHGLDKDLPLADSRPLERYLDASVAARRFTMLLLGAFAAVAVTLAAIGIAGVMTNSVSQRTREIGVRLALGAQPSDVLGMVLRQGMSLAGIGIAVGVAGAVALTRVLASLLYGTAPTDAVTFAAVVALLAAVGLAATWLPARRATRVDPAEALRAE